MSIADSDRISRKLRAPRESNQRLIVPDASLSGELLAANRGERLTSPKSIADRQLTDLARQARAELLEAATNYTRQYRDVSLVSDLSADSRIVMSGHQPELFHPGVWFKNFLLDQLAQKDDALPIQLIIDNDLCHSPVIRVPQGSVTEPAISAIPFDADNLQLPYEERRLVDRVAFDRFPAQVAQAIAPFIQSPLVHSVWPHMQRAADRANSLGQIIAEGRHRYEGTLGLNTLELPWSSVCDTRSFIRFMLHLLDDLPSFHALHNDVVIEYRQRHRLRSQSHPVPLLRRVKEWWETPFWIWSDVASERRPLWLRQRSDRWYLRGSAPTSAATDPHDISIDMSLPDLDDVIDQFQMLRQAGIKIRSRALITTMYARTILSDLFVHGIGGSVYDQLTDRFIADFLQFRPPSFITASATVLLPLQRPAVDVDDVRKLDGLLRNLWYHPEQHLEWASDADQLSTVVSARIDEKQAWLRVDTQQPNVARMRHLALDRINSDLRQLLEPARHHLMAERQTLVQQLRARGLLSSREFSYAIFPAEMLVPCLQRLASASDDTINAHADRLEHHHPD